MQCNHFRLDCRQRVDDTRSGTVFARNPLKWKETEQLIDRRFLLSHWVYSVRTDGGPPKTILEELWPVCET
eukprot:3331904-Amphidinium_carterae.1